MLVRIIRAFDTTTMTRLRPGDEIDVDPQIAARWIDEGNAVYDSDNQADANALTSDEVVALRAALTGQFSSTVYETYDTDKKRLTAFSRAGVAHTVTYPDANTAVVTNALGAQRTITFDAQGLVTGIV